MSFILFLCSTFATCQPMAHVVMGKFSVGFQSIVNIDLTRPSRSNGIGRSVQINTWYPATKTIGPAMNYAEYIFLTSKEDSAVKVIDKNACITQYLSELASRGSDIDSWTKFLASKESMNAFKDARFLKGDYPIILLMHGSAASHSFMGEFLASHGMIVISTPYKGYLQNAFDVNVIGMETEIRDHEYALSVITSNFDLHPAKIGVAGVSFGGQSAIGLAVRNKLVKGVVSLDGGIGSPTGPQLLSQFPFFSLEKVNMPILHLYNPSDNGGNLNWFDVCEYTDRYLIGFKHMDHSFFVSYGALDKVINNVIGPSKPKAGDNYAAILAYTLSFFNEVFLNGLSDPANVLELDKKQPWIGVNVESKFFLKKKWSPVPQEELMKILTTNGIPALMNRYEQQKAVSTMPISDASYRALITNRFNAPDPEGMTLIAEKYEKDFPTSAIAKYFRGRALQLNSDQELARNFFRQCLDLLTSDVTMSAVDKAAYKSRCEGFLK